MRSSVKQLLNRETQAFQIRKSRAHIFVCRNYCTQPNETRESEGGKKKWEVPVEDPDKGRGDDHSMLKGVKKHLEKEIKTAKDMVKNIPKIKETKEEIKDLAASLRKL